MTITDPAKLTLARAITAYILLKLPVEYDSPVANLNQLVIECVRVVDAVIERDVKPKRKGAKRKGAKTV